MKYLLMTVYNSELFGNMLCIATNFKAYCVLFLILIRDLHAPALGLGQYKWVQRALQIGMAYGKSTMRMLDRMERDEPLQLWGSVAPWVTCCTPYTNSPVGATANSGPTMHKPAVGDFQEPGGRNSNGLAVCWCSFNSRRTKRE